MKFIIDKEINLKSRTGKSPDALNTSTYADRLIECIEQAPGNRSFTIGLFGEWGCGKSSVIKTMGDTYPSKAQADHKNVKIVKYDAWKYSDDSFRRMFLLELQQQLDIEPSEKMRRFYDNINEDTEIKHVTNSNYIYLIIAVLFVLCLLFIFGNEADSKWQLSLVTFITMATLLMNLKKNSTDDLKVTVQKSRLFAPEQFEDCFDDIIQAAFRSHSLSEKVLSWVVSRQYNIDLDQLVIVVDNIDRCQSDIAYKLLTDIKNFLDKLSNVVFVVPVDVDALRKHILSSPNLTKDELNQDADEFLRKFFNVSIWMKPFRTDEIFEFASILNKDNQLDFNETTLNLVSKHFATNPRRIIQLFNNLSVELQGYTDNVKVEDQSLIAKVQIIKEEFPEFYQMLLSEPRHIYKDYKSQLEISSRDSHELSPDEILVRDNKRLLLFLSHTLAVTTPYINQETKISNVLSNAKTFEGMPQGLTDAIDVNDYLFLKSLEGLQEYLPKIIKYLNFQMRKAIQRNLFKTDVLIYLDMYLHLFKDNYLSISDKKELMNIIGEYNTLNSIVSNIPQLDVLIELGKDVEILHLKKLSQSIIDYLKIEDGPENPKLTEKNCKAILKGCSLWSQGQVKQLVKEFALAYNMNPIEAQKYRYMQNYSVLITDELVEEKITEIDKDSMFEDSSAFQSVRYFAEHKVFSEELFNKFASKITELSIKYLWRTNNAMDLLPYIKEIYPIIGNCIQTKKLNDTTALSDLWSSISGRTSVAGSGTKSLILDNVANSEVISIIVELFYTMTAIGQKVIIPHDEITNIMLHKENQGIMIAKLHELMLNGFDTSNYSEALCKCELFNEYHIEMLCQFFKCADAIIAPNARKLSELSHLLDILIDGTHDKCKPISIMLDELTAEESMGQDFEVLLKKLSTDSISKLSSKLQRFAIAKFVEDIEDNKDNEKVLTCIAKYGNPSEITQLVPVINTKLVNSNTLSESSLAMTARVILNLNSLRINEIEQIKANLANVPENKLSQESVKQCIDHIQSIGK